MILQNICNVVFTERSKRDLAAHEKRSNKYVSNRLQLFLLLHWCMYVCSVCVYALSTHSGIWFLFCWLALFISICCFLRCGSPKICSTMVNFPCEFCNRAFRSEAGQEKHMKLHYDPSYKCLDCADFFVTAFSLHRHCETNHSDSVVCSIFASPLHVLVYHFSFSLVRLLISHPPPV